MTPTIIIDFHDSSRGRDALAFARGLGEVTGARYVTVTSYTHDRFGMLPVQSWHSATPQKTRDAAELPGACWRRSPELSRA
jgi:hypothetical protein